MKTFLMAVVLGFVLSPGSLLRRNATYLAELPTSKVAFSSKLSFVDASVFPGRWKPVENSLKAQWTMDASAKSCALSLVSPEGTWNVVWKNGLISNAKEGGPAVEAMLSGVCGIFTANASGAEVRGALEKFLSSLKINVKASRLELVEREVVYAIGEAGARAPQYWIDKEDFSVRGLKWTDTAGILWELRFKQRDRFWEAIEVWREGQMVLRVLAESAES